MIKKFKAPNMMAAMRMAKEALGDDAIILQSKKVKEPGLLGDLAGIEMVEITATTEESLAEKTGESEGSADTPANQFYSPSTVHKIRNVQAENYGQIKADLDGLKEAVTDMSEYLRYDKMLILPETMHFLTKELGIEDSLASTLLQAMVFSLEGGDLKDKSKINKALRKEVCNYLRVNNDVSLPKGEPKKICLVGPTGTGKTTSIIKMATHPRCYGTKRVAIITIDTYRVAAAAQLKTFTALAKLPLEIVYEKTEFGLALDNFKDYEVILIDTAGRSPHNKQHLKELGNFLEVGKPHELHLVVSASTRTDSLLDAARNFAQLGANRLIISKIDETVRLGSILNFCSKIDLPISFLTNGQIVPDDIIIAEKKEVASRIIIP